MRNCLPALSDGAGRTRRAVLDLVEELLPNRLARPLMTAADVDPAVRGAYLGQKERNRLVQTLKGWPLGRVRHVPLERGEVVAGGVSLDEVDPQTMRSRRVRGLYLCGEVLDIAGPVGGYNLQAAWSTWFRRGRHRRLGLYWQHGYNSAMSVRKIVLWSGAAGLLT